MCRAASFIVTRSDVLFSEVSDYHEDIITENSLNDREVNFVRTELVPPDYDYSIPIAGWKYYTDQQEVPEWYNAQEAEIACRDALPEWFRYHIFAEDSVHDLAGRRNVSLIFLAGKHEVSNLESGDVQAYGTSIVNSSQQSGGSVWACDTSTVNFSQLSEGEVRAYGTSTVNSSRQSGGEVWAYGTSTVNSTKQSGGWVWVYDTSTVNSTKQSGGLVMSLGGTINEEGHTNV